MYGHADYPAAPPVGPGGAGVRAVRIVWLPRARFGRGRRQARAQVQGARGERIRRICPGNACAGPAGGGVCGAGCRIGRIRIQPSPHRHGALARHHHRHPGRLRGALEDPHARAGRHHDGPAVGGRQRGALGRVQERPDRPGVGQRGRVVRPQGLHQLGPRRAPRVPAPGPDHVLVRAVALAHVLRVFGLPQLARGLLPELRRRLRRPGHL
ncbi:hypothetical protein DFJ74DRAFT_697342 [Hyaloraphidium curvatum]|nr:hypothetical protein DFJ74DRAFT_697342 [Hyaloraphidium curvatum]